MKIISANMLGILKLREQMDVICFMFRERLNFIWYKVVTSCQT